MCLPVRGPNPLFEHATSSLRIMQPQPHSFSCLFLPYKICPSRHQLSTVFSFSSGFHGLCRKKDVNSGTVNGDKGGTSSDCLNIQKTDFFLSEGKYKLPQQKCRFLQKTTQSALFLIFHEKCIFLILLWFGPDFLAWISWQRASLSPLINWKYSFLNHSGKIILYSNSKSLMSQFLPIIDVEFSVHPLQKKLTVWERQLTSHL